VCEQFRATTGNRRNPSPRTPDVTAQFLVFLSGPLDQFLIQLSQHRAKPGAVKPSVVLDPAANNRIVEAGQIIQELMTAVSQPPERPPFAVAKSMSLFSIPSIEPWLVYQDNPTLENR
jgi:hypothetical protein